MLQGSISEEHRGAIRRRKREKDRKKQDERTGLLLSMTKSLIYLLRSAKFTLFALLGR